MEEKKAKHANLENKKGIFLQIGFVITLTIILMAFEWSVEKHQVIIPIDETYFGPETVMINTYRNEEKIERPKPNLFITNILQLIPDEIDPGEDDLTFDVGDDQNTKNNYNYTFEPEPVDDIPFIIVEDMPIFRPQINKTREQGDIDLHKYVASRIKYPEMARANSIIGKVFVIFVVDKSGNVTNVSVARKTDPLLDKEAIRVVKSLPKFKPGKQLGKAVNVSYQVVINFRLS